MSEVTAAGSRLITQWLSAQEQVDRTRDELSRRHLDLREAETALAKWLTPSDAKPGEKIAVWFGDSLIQVEVGGVPQGEPVNGVGPAPTQTRVTVRTRGKHFHRFREAV